MTLPDPNLASLGNISHAPTKSAAVPGDLGTITRQTWKCCPLAGMASGRDAGCPNALGVDRAIFQVHAAGRLVEHAAALDCHVSNRFIGVSLLTPLLTLSARADVAEKLGLRGDYPPWLFPVEPGATTPWER